MVETRATSKELQEAMEAAKGSRGGKATYTDKLAEIEARAEENARLEKAREERREAAKDRGCCAGGCTSSWALCTE